MLSIRKPKRVVVAVLAIAVLITTPAAGSDDSRLLPDLRQAPVGCPGGFSGDPSTCDDWDVCLVADADSPSGRCMTSGRADAVRLRFTSAEDNVGDGPLLIFGHRDSVDQPTMAVRQAFQTTGSDVLPDSFGAAQHPTTNSMYYEPARMHQHWHLMGFERFQLRNLSGGTVVADRKNGFCLGDRYKTHDAGSLPNTPNGDAGATGRLGKFLRANMCKHHDVSALDVTEGISVGSGDDYKHTVDFQWLDITEVPSGVYDVVNTVNDDRTLVEKSYDNNTSSIAVSIQWPGGAGKAPAAITRPPEVELLRSCPGQAQCANQLR